MYSTKEVKEIDDLDVFKFYLGEFKLEERFLSPLRKERNPSFVIFRGRDGKYRYKDFGTGEHGDKINLVESLFGLAHNGALRKISQDLSGVTCFLGLPNKPQLSKETYQKITDIKIKRRPFSEADLEFWNSFGINKEILDKFQVFSISHYWINDKIIYISKNQLCYAYSISGRFKIYSPMSVHKWINNADATLIQGFNQLAEKGELLVITKALKDVMLLDSLGLSAIAPQSETILLDKDIIDNLYKRFDNIVTFFDNDETGINLAKRYLDIYGIRSCFIPENCCSKDISDYYKHFGADKTRELLKTLNLI